MSDCSEQILAAVSEIRALLRLMAEPQIAARDHKLRDELVKIVGKSVPKQKAVLLMDGSHTKSAINQKTKINKGQLSTLVKQLGTKKLLGENGKMPKLAISITTTFFEK